MESRLKERERKRFEEMRKLVADETTREVYENLKRNRDKTLA